MERTFEMQITLGNINLNMVFIRTNAMPFFKHLAIFLIPTVNHMLAGDSDKNCMRFLFIAGDTVTINSTGNTHKIEEEFC